MADPNLLPEFSDVAKVGGGGALASALTVLAGRIFGGQDKVIARLDVLHTSMTDLAQKLAVLVATSARRDTEFDDLKEQVHEHSMKLAKLEAMLEQLSEGH